jgi:predicted DNA-binding antitoxin AbrB/MazE fold protein
MTMMITAVYENGVLRPLHPLNIPENKTVTIAVDPINNHEQRSRSSTVWSRNLSAHADKVTNPLADLHEYAIDDPDMPVDYAENLDHYLYGLPKRTNRLP